MRKFQKYLVLPFFFGYDGVGGCGFDSGTGYDGGCGYNSGTGYDGGCGYDSGSTGTGYDGGCGYE